jgi:hypothetical protein
MNASDFSQFYRLLEPHLMSYTNEPDELVQARTFSLIVKLAMISSTSFDALDNLNLISFAKSFTFDDLLLALTLVEVFIQARRKLRKISKSMQGLEFLEKTGVMRQFAEKLGVQYKNESFVIRSVIKFWGLLLSNDDLNCTEIDAKYGIAEGFLRLYEFDDDSIKDSIIVALGNIASHQSGLLILQGKQRLVELFLDPIPRLTGELKLSSLRTLSCIFNGS